MPPKRDKKKRQDLPHGASAAKKASGKTTPKSANVTHSQAQRAHATAKHLVARHGPLTQLNDVYAGESGSTSSESHGGSTARLSTSDSDVPLLGVADRARQKHLEARRRALLRLPRPCLALYVQLAERGLEAGACPFASIIAHRACQLQAEQLEKQQKGHL